MSFFQHFSLAIIIGIYSNITFASDSKEIEKATSEFEKIYKQNVKFISREDIDINNAINNKYMGLAHTNDVKKILPCHIEIEYSKNNNYSSDYLDLGTLVVVEKGKKQPQQKFFSVAMAIESTMTLRFLWVKSKEEQDTLFNSAKKLQALCSYLKPEGNNK